MSRFDDAKVKLPARGSFEEPPVLATSLFHEFVLHADDISKFYYKKMLQNTFNSFFMSTSLKFYDFISIFAAHRRSTRMVRIFRDKKIMDVLYMYIHTHIYTHVHTFRNNFYMGENKKYHTLFYLTNDFVATPISFVRNIVSDPRILRLQVCVGLHEKHLSGERRRRLAQNESWAQALLRGAM